MKIPFATYGQNPWTHDIGVIVTCEPQREPIRRLDPGS